VIETGSGGVTVSVVLLVRFPSAGGAVAVIVV
jgi:hypothetical protein